MKKLNKISLAIGAALAATSILGYAGTLTFHDGTADTVSVERASTGDLDGVLGTTSKSDVAVTLTPGTGTVNNDRVMITLSNGATFADSKYVLAVSTGSDSTADLTKTQLMTTQPQGLATLEFRVTTNITGNYEYVLSGSNAASQPVTVNIPAIAAGSKIEMGYELREGGNTGTIYDEASGVDIFEMVNQFSASFDKKASAVIDVNEDRKKFENAMTSDTIELSFASATGIDLPLTLTADDKVDFVLSGDLTDIASIAVSTVISGGTPTDRGDFTIDGDTATFEADASDLFAASTSTVITATVNGSEALATRSFTVEAELDFETETDKTLVAAGTDAGEWTINGLQAKVSQLGLNSTGFVTWLKVVNEGKTAAEITADIIWTLQDGTEGSASAQSLGTADAGGIFTISEAAILAAMGNPEQRADVSMTVTVAGQQNSVHIIAEKKASDGRTMIPVYYDASDLQNGRKWVQ